MKILVTGSAGTIATRVIEMLLAAGHTVIGIDRKRNPWNADIDALTQQRDLLSADALDAIPVTDAVIHLAAWSRVYELVAEPFKAVENVITTARVLEWVRLHHIPRLVFASSRECYGSVEGKLCTEGMARVEHSENAYGASKISCEAFVHAYRRNFSIPAVMLRYANVYGAYDIADRVVPIFIQKARNQEMLRLFGEGKTLDFTHIDDAARGTLLALEKFSSVNGETLNIASGEATTLLKCAEKIVSTLGSRSGIVIDPPRMGEVLHFTADISRAKKMLGYVPQVPFSQGIVRAVEWYMAYT